VNDVKQVYVVIRNTLQYIYPESVLSGLKHSESRKSNNNISLAWLCHGIRQAFIIITHLHN
jgi:hypothetical protein